MGSEAIGLLFAGAVFGIWGMVTGRLGALGRSAGTGPSSDAELVRWTERCVPAAELIRKEGLLSFESHRAKLSDPLLQRGVKWLAEGFEFSVIEDWLSGEAQRKRAEGARRERDLEALSEFVVAAGFAGALAARFFASAAAPHWVGAPTFAISVLIALLIFSELKHRHRDRQELIERQLVLIRLVLKGIAQGQASGPLTELARIRVRAE